MSGKKLTATALLVTGMVFGAIAAGEPATSGNSQLNLLPWPQCCRRSCWL